jgi:hypothetical protein
MNCEVDVNENNGPQHMPHDHFQPQNVDWKEDIRDSTPLNDGWYSNLIFVSWMYMTWYWRLKESISCPIRETHSSLQFQVADGIRAEGQVHAHYEQLKSREGTTRNWLRLADRGNAPPPKGSFSKWGLRKALRWYYEETSRFTPRKHNDVSLVESLPNTFVCLVYWQARGPGDWASGSGVAVQIPMPAL